MANSSVAELCSFSAVAISEDTSTTCFDSLRICDRLAGMAGFASVRDDPARHLVHVINSALCFILNGTNNRLDFSCRTRGSLRQFPHLIGNDGESKPMLSGSCGLNGGVERQQVGQLSNLLDRSSDPTDFDRSSSQFLHRLRRGVRPQP